MSGGRDGGKFPQRALHRCRTRLRCRTCTARTCPLTATATPWSGITRGQDADFYYPNGQLATTMWYHDHIMGRTRVNVYAGLVGTSFSSMETLSTPTFLKF